MKIKTITCHDVYNVGASLQAYALAEYLNKLGHDAEIIDYKPDYLSNHYKLWHVSNPVYDKPFVRIIYNLLKLSGRIKARNSKRKKEFDYFTQNLLPLTNKRYYSIDELTSNPPFADVYFAGSDQIWNCIFQNGRDAAFYLEFAPTDSIKASYAASFSTEEIPEIYKEQIKKWLLGLDFLSVRESSGVTIIESMGIKNALSVVDPVFLLTADEWECIEKDLNLEEPYILLYDFDNNSKIKETVLQLSEERHLKIYSLLPSDICDKCFSEEGPMAFLYLIHHASFIVSNSFHATAFSLIWEKEFVVFNRQEGINTRMRDLLDTVGLLNRLIEADNSYDESFIDYNVVNSKMNNKIDRSKAYIDMVLKSKKR